MQIFHGFWLGFVYLIFSNLVNDEWLVRAGDGVGANIPEGRRAVLVCGRDLEDEVREDSLLHLGAVLLLAPLRDVLVDVRNRHVNIHAEMSSIKILTTFKLQLGFFPENILGIPGT